MFNLEPNIKIYLATGHTDMRKGINGLSILANKIISDQLIEGALFVFRGKRSDRMKVLWWDGQVVSRSAHSKHCNVRMF